MKFFYGSVCLTNQKPRAFVSVRLLFLFCSRVFISRSYENRSNPTLKTNHYDIIRLQLERNDEFDDEGYARLPIAVQPALVSSRGGTRSNARGWRKSNLVWRKGMGKTRLQTRLKLNGIVPYFCALWTPIRPVAEVNKKKRGLEPTERKVNI